MTRLAAEHKNERLRLLMARTDEEVERDISRLPLDEDTKEFLRELAHGVREVMAMATREKRSG